MLVVATSVCGCEAGF